MEEDDLDVGVLAVLVEEVLEEVRDRLVRDVTADHDVPTAETTLQSLAWEPSLSTQMLGPQGKTLLSSRSRR